MNSVIAIVALLAVSDILQANLSFAVAAPQTIKKHHISTTNVEHLLQNGRSKPVSEKDRYVNHDSDSSEHDFMHHQTLHRESHVMESEEESPIKRDTYVASITNLHHRLGTLNKNLQGQRHKKTMAMDEFNKALDNRNSIAATAQDISEKRRSLERRLFDARAQLSKHESELRDLERKATTGRSSIKALEGRGRDILKQHKYITEDFQSHALQHWVNNSLNSSSVNPVLRGAFIHGAAKIVGPVLDGIDRLVDVKSEMTNTVSGELPAQLVVADNSFYAGFITNIVLLTPLVLAMSAVLKIKRSMTRMTVGHIIMLGNAYFGLLSFGCFIATTLMYVDVMNTLASSQLWFFHFLMMAHTAAFLLLVFAHLIAAVRCQSNVTFFHLIMQFAVGIHFISHSIGHSIRGQILNVDKLAYVVYTMVFGSVLLQFCLRRAELESLRGGCIIEHKARGLNDTYIPIDMPIIYTFGHEMNAGQTIPHGEIPSSIDMDSEHSIGHEGNTTVHENVSSTANNLTNSECQTQLTNGADDDELTARS